MLKLSPKNKFEWNFFCEANYRIFLNIENYSIFQNGKIIWQTHVEAGPILWYRPAPIISTVISNGSKDPANLIWPATPAFYHYQLGSRQGRKPKQKHSGKYQDYGGMFQRPYQTNNNTAKNTDRDWSLVVTMATTIMATKLVQSMVHWLMREFPSLLLGVFSLLGGWLFAGIFLLLFYILRYRWVCLIRHVCLSRIWSHSFFFFFIIFLM